MTIDGRIARGDRTRAAVLDRAVARATEDGLDGLSLGQLATDLGVSKSGLFAHWRSKEELQLATIERAADQFREHVVRPALRAGRGVHRLWSLHDHRIAFYEASYLPGGCFFAKVQFEFSARPGVIRDRLAANFQEYTDMVDRLGREAVAAGHLVAGTDTRQLAYEFESFALTAVLKSRLLLFPEVAYGYARRAAHDRLRALATDPELLPEE
ncbi:TetR/AcrR family transcriptional regulator [Asanoa siamensis]|uniref:TetR family transcriptional regulator n=1 Tax=Asanoa siamensis TaxID=926357 RepID=A0ABQ4CVM7_9ACTN|nr:TetR/AcrR family transcriptional regulator [Asanoa siamensis]GIF75336.1 TetR family transcriptional regulator [Asanoa siamensis]